MELADVLDSKSSGSDTVPVRPRSPAPKKQAVSLLFLISVYFTFKFFVNLNDFKSYFIV